MIRCQNDLLLKILYFGKQSTPKNAPFLTAERFREQSVPRSTAFPEALVNEVSFCNPLRSTK